MDGWIDGWMDAPMDGRMDGWTDRWMDGRSERERHIYARLLRNCVAMSHE